MTTPPDPREENLAARLRSALTWEASTMAPSDDALTRIRERIAGRRRWYRHPALVAVAAAVVLAAAVVGGLALYGGDTEPDTVTSAGTGPASRTASDTPSVTDSATSPSDTASPSPPAAPVEGWVYVYYLRDDGTGPRLYRERRPNPGTEPVQAALATMLGEPALDPDYTSAWPSGTTVLGYSVAADTATVDLSDFTEVGTAADSVGVQQLVYTVTANDPRVRRVRVLVNGEPPSSGRDWSTPVARAPRAQVQAPIWLLAPTEGQTVSAPVRIRGYGTAFEATISWAVYQGSTKVAEGFTQGGANGAFAPFADTVTLPPGRYEIRAFEVSAEDGSPRNVDTKTFTVE